MVKADMSDIGSDVKIQSVSMEGDDVMVFKWTDRSQLGTHEGAIPSAYLRWACYSEKAMEDRVAQREMKFAKDKVIPEVDHSELSSETGVYKWLTALSETGISLIKNVPLELGTVAKVAELIAPLQHTIYGEVFNVISMPQPINAAYSPVRLDLHCDQPHYESPPGIQLLHCLKSDPGLVGGENTFADIHEVAHQFRKDHGKYFETLCRVPYTAQTVHYSRDYPVHIEMQRTIFVLNHRKELVSVMWHPMLLGPLQVAHDDVEPFYEAFSKFHQALRNHASKYEHRLVPGDLIAFNNRRVLHGRNAFLAETGERHLQGTYIEISEFQSQVQVYHNKYGNGRLATRSGSLNFM